MIQATYLFVLLSALLCCSFASADEKTPDDPNQKKWLDLIAQTPKQHPLVVAVKFFQDHPSVQSLKCSANDMRDSWVVAIRLRRIANRLETMSPERAAETWEREFTRLEWDLQNGEVSAAHQGLWLKILREWKEQAASDKKRLPAALRQMGLIVTGVLLNHDASAIQVALTGANGNNVLLEQEYHAVAFHPPYPGLIPFDPAHSQRDWAENERRLARLRWERSWPEHEWFNWKIEQLELARDAYERGLMQLEQQREYYKQQHAWYEQLYARYSGDRSPYGDWYNDRSYVMPQPSPCYQPCRPCFRPLRWLFCR